MRRNARFQTIVAEPDHITLIRTVRILASSLNAAYLMLLHLNSPFDAQILSASLHPYGSSDSRRERRVYSTQNDSGGSFASMEEELPNGIPYILLLDHMVLE